jgi:cytochrome c peroxidase
MTPDEMAGYKLFDGKGNCNSCTPDGKGTALRARSDGYQQSAGGRARVHMLRLGE